MIGHGLEEPGFGIGVPLETPDFIRGGNEMPGKTEQLGVGPDRPPARDTVASGAPKRMSVHDPEEQRLPLLLGLKDSGPERRDPGNLLEAQVGAGRNEKCFPRGPVAPVEIFLKNRRPLLGGSWTAGWENEENQGGGEEGPDHGFRVSASPDPSQDWTCRGRKLN